MITKEFRRWAEDIKSLIEKQVGDLAYIWVADTQLDVISIGIDFSEGQRFWMSFCQQEFDRNNKREKNRLVKIRCEDLTREIKDLAEKAIKIVNILQ